MYLNKGQALLVDNPRGDWGFGKKLKNKIVIVKENGECSQMCVIDVQFDINNKSDSIGVYSDEFMVLK
jgi:hypothetical protein